VVVPAGATETIGRTIAAVADLGYNSQERKYVMFVDASVYCGLATVEGDSTPSPDNINNIRNGYARIDNGCWSTWVVAHELVHTLGGVQLDAPNSSGGWHCVDEFDVMCYSDAPFYPAMQQRCPESRAYLLDCNNDDYFHTNPPPGSYLATHWNVAHSDFLITRKASQNSLPTLDLLVQTSNDQVVEPATITLTAKASDPDGVVTAVEFYQGDTLLANVTAGPYTFVWAEVVSGTYTITAKVYDDIGASTTSDPLTIVVAEPSALSDPHSGEGEASHRAYLPLVVSDDRQDR
jgi:hypothetical protein